MINKETHKESFNINTFSQKKCILCNFEGEMLYYGLKDMLFNTPGLWNVKKCTNPECGLLWLDPMPKETDIHKLYDTYYTHGNINTENPDIYLKDKIKSFLRKYLWKTVLLSFTRRKNKRMYLDNIPVGKLLEIGCGDGSRLTLMKKRGWDIYGQEIDKKAADIAKKNNPDTIIYLGDIRKINLPKNYFDVIIMNHVIEHIIDPLSFLKECFNLLKSSGYLVITTPNSKSFGHKLFKEYWRGLEPPRHLNIFSVSSIKYLIKQTNFKIHKISTTNSSAAYIFWASFDIKSYKHFSIQKPSLRSCIKALVLKMFSIFTIIFYKSSGEECRLIVTK